MGELIKVRAGYCKACQICATKKTAGQHQKAEMCRYDVGFPNGPFLESDLGEQVSLCSGGHFFKMDRGISSSKHEDRDSQGKAGSGVHSQIWGAVSRTTV